MRKKKNTNIPIAKTFLTKNEINSVVKPLNSGWLVQGQYVHEFEKKFSKYTESKYSIAVTSCTSALHLSLAALGFKANDEAIVPAFTWVSTANAVEYLNGKVKFCDIDLDTFNIDTNKIEKLITKNTKAILPVHLFGLPANMIEIKRIAKKHKLIVVEDAACSLGSFYRKMHTGTIGDTGCFSFHPRKSITTGEGGIITTNNARLAKKLRILRDHGAEMSDLQRHLGSKPYLLADHVELGFNYRMTDIQGILGSMQMNRVKKIINERRSLAKYYIENLNELNWLKLPNDQENSIHSYQSFPCLFQPQKLINLSKSNYKKILIEINKTRNKIMDYLFQKGISTRPATHAVHMLSFYKNKYKLKDEDFYYAHIANDASISLPLYNGMKKSDQNFVISTLKNIKI